MAGGYKKRQKVVQETPASIEFLRSNCGRENHKKNLEQGKVTLNVSQIARIAGVNKVLLFNIIGGKIRNYTKYKSEINAISQVIENNK